MCHDRPVITAFIYLLVMLLVAGVVFLLAAMVFGRGEELEPLAPGVSPTRLPATDINGDDIAQVRFQLVLRGYKMSEVDWVMQRLGAELDELRSRVTELEALGGGEVDAGPAGESALGLEPSEHAGNGVRTAEPALAAAELDEAARRRARAAEVKARFAQEVRERQPGESGDPDGGA